MDLLGRSQRTSTGKISDVHKAEDTYDDYQNRNLFRSALLIILAEQNTEEEWQTAIIKAKKQTDRILKLPIPQRDETR